MLTAMEKRSWMVTVGIVLVNSSGRFGYGLTNLDIGPEQIDLPYDGIDQTAMERMTSTKMVMDASQMFFGYSNHRSREPGKPVETVGTTTSDRRFKA